MDFYTSVQKVYNIETQILGGGAEKKLVVGNQKGEGFSERKEEPNFQVESNDF